MKKLVVMTIVLGVATAHAEEPHAKMKAGRYPEKAAAWKKFALKDITLDSAFYKVSGFTCGPDPASRGFTTYRHTCVKFLDDRCKGRPSKINHIRTAAEVPRGQVCFMDEGSGGTYLDGAFVSPAMSSLSIVATDTTAPVIYEINLVLPPDDLTETSNLGKALIAKYGRPTSYDPPRQMRWDSGDVRLTANCRGTQGPTGEYCTIQVTDTALLDAERSIQQAADDDERHSKAPAAPKL
jgi:hypothetical protein